MLLVLDTNALIEVERNNAKVLQKLESLSRTYPGQLATTFLNVFECLVGFKNRYTDEGIKFLNNFVVLNTTKQTPFILAELKTRYDTQGMSLPFIDMAIAALVIENRAILITTDKGFERIEELQKIFI